MPVVELGPADDGPGGHREDRVRPGSRPGHRLQTRRRRLLRRRDPGDQGQAPDRPARSAEQDPVRPDGVRHLHEGPAGVRRERCDAVDAIRPPGRARSDRSAWTAASRSSPSATRARPWPKRSGRSPTA
ncbi:MAG: hypothetical protein M0C28_32445 [Candidatus Moduliflexus flocculans]|nr:hypothetical protein [Candidatus Moduliflexus flocculans]